MDRAQDTFKLLETDVTTLSYVHGFYTTLYGNRESVARMNEISGSAFRIIQDALVNDLLRMICALTDPAGSGERQNAAIERVLNELEEDDPLLFQRCEPFQKRLEEALVVIREHRNKRLTHFDLESKRGNIELHPLLTDHLDSAVQSICSIMEEASKSLNDTDHIAFDVVIDGPNARGAMTWLLSDAVRFKRLRQLAKTPAFDAEQLKSMVADRSGRHDPV